jgi:Dimerisation domain
MAIDTTTQLTPERLMQFTFGFAPPLIIEAGIRHRVFNVLDEGAKTIEQLCAATGASPRGLRAILNALAGLGLLAKEDKDRYALTPESATFLVSGKPSFHGAFFLLTAEPMLSKWRKLYEIVVSGRPAQHINQTQDGVPFFLQFVEQIFPIHYPAAKQLGEALGVAGGDGTGFRTRFGSRVRRVEHRSCLAIALCPRNRGRLAGDNPGNAEGNSGAWCCRSLQFRRRRLARSGVWKRTRNRDSLAHCAQRG